MWHLGWFSKFWSHMCNNLARQWASITDMLFVLVQLPYLAILSALYYQSLICLNVGVKLIFYPACLVDSFKLCDIDYIVMAVYILITCALIANLYIRYRDDIHWLISMMIKNLLSFQCLYYSNKVVYSNKPSYHYNHVHFDSNFENDMFENNAWILEHAWCLEKIE